MKLHRLYSNQPELFEPIEFNDGLSAIVAEIRVPDNRDLDTHNLGKTTVGELIDFCLLKGKDSDFFLFKHLELFNEFCFYLELMLPNGIFLTIGRRVDPGTRIEFIQTDASLSEAFLLSEAEWDHFDITIERALTLLDGVIEIDALHPWRFRKLAGYLIRSQQDYKQVFQLAKFAGKHRDWKPFVAHLLGMPAQPAQDLYLTKAEFEAVETKLKDITEEWSGEEVDTLVCLGLVVHYL